MSLDYHLEKDGSRTLHAHLVSMPDEVHKKGMGTEIVQNIMHIAHEGGFNAVTYDAVSGGPLKGAYVWAKMGATFADANDRERVVERYIAFSGRHGTIPPDEEDRMLKMWEPRDILNAPEGGRFLLGDVSYRGRFAVR